MTENNRLVNYVNNEWRASATGEYLPVVNPATRQVLANVPLSTQADVDQAVQAAAQAQVQWREMPAVDRVQYLFKLKALLEEHLEELAQTITMECGKTLGESYGELKRAIENVEVACGMPLMLQGVNSEDIASGIDEHMFRQPVGVSAAICPFNFPGMIPFWFMPYALAAGNTYIVKPSEKTPVTMQKVFHLVEQLGLPPGVLNMVHGSQQAVNTLLDHPAVRAISFVGSTKVARYVYSRATANGKRAQCQGGAKNPIVVMPDADPEPATRIIADSAFGCAGQRCLAASLAITVGEADGWFTEAIADAAHQRKVGYGLEPGVEMGPVITVESKQRVQSLLAAGAQAGAEILVDGRDPHISGFEGGNFVCPSVLRGVDPNSQIAQTEIFGPVLGLMHVNDIDEAIELVNRGAYGNMACLFTSNGNVARKFRYQVQAGNIGINIGVAAPMAFFPFSGWKESFFGDLHGQGMDALEFFTQKKVVVERWPREWSRQF